MPDLLIELLSEEIPARMQKEAAQTLEKLIDRGLSDAGLKPLKTESFFTPRRLTVRVNDLLSRSPVAREERRGPRISAPDKAIEGFARSVGVNRDQLVTRKTKKGSFLFAVFEISGRSVEDIVADVLDDSIRNFPWSKSMRWGSGDLRWIRPLHRILCILSDADGTRTVPFEIDGLVADNVTEGHTFMAPQQFSVESVDDYFRKLEDAKVLVDEAVRRRRITRKIKQLVTQSHLELCGHDELVDEIVNLVEWPVVLLGDIPGDYAHMPREIIQSALMKHHKCLCLYHPESRKPEKFITVANRQTSDSGSAIIAGTERVISARLEDAKFFWEEDCHAIKQNGFHTWLAALDNITFHHELGSQAERVERIAEAAAVISEFVDGASPVETVRSASVSKADLVSKIVSEYPELQGIMGGYYAIMADYPQTVLEAVQEHYLPTGATDRVPQNPVAIAIALADRLDVLTGFWVIDEKPTGSQDPFALRRSALSVLRIVLENNLRIPLAAVTGCLLIRHNSTRIEDLTDDDLKKFCSKAKEYDCFLTFLSEIKVTPREQVPQSFLTLTENLQEQLEDLFGFIHERLRVFLMKQGVRFDAIDACLATTFGDDLTLLAKRIRALDVFLSSSNGENLIQGFKRANNILIQAESKDGIVYSSCPDSSLAETQCERDLFAILDIVTGEIDRALQEEDYEGAMRSMSSLRAPVDVFFEEVKINVDDMAVRRNRLELLNGVREVCHKIADLTLVSG